MPEPFRLQSVLRLRESFQNERQAELAQAVQAEQILQEQISEAEGRLQEIEADLRQSATALIDVDRLNSLRRYQADTKRLLHQLLEQRRLVEQEIERRQIRLADARKEVKVIESLEQLHRQTQQTRQFQTEQEALDEFAQTPRTRL